MKVVQRNRFFGYSENIFIEMLDGNQKIRRLGAEKVVSIRQELSSSASLNLCAIFKSRNGEHSSESDCDTFSTISIIY